MRLVRTERESKTKGAIDRCAWCHLRAACASATASPLERTRAALRAP
jgi:hypothetical protein